MKEEEEKERENILRIFFFYFYVSCFEKQNILYWYLSVLVLTPHPVLPKQKAVDYQIFFTRFIVLGKIEK